MNNFAVLAISQASSPNTETIVITTNNPCHLWLSWTENKPIRHKDVRRLRGLETAWGAYWCLNALTMVEQQETGDTLTHTFVVTPWAHCTTRWFIFFGTVAGIKSPSVSAIYEKHHIEYLTIEILPFKDSGIRNRYPWTNYGSLVHGFCLDSDGPAHLPARTLFSFDLSFLPPGTMLTRADLTLTVYARSNVNTGKALWFCKLTRRDWIESQVTWTQYKAGFFWNTFGGDFTIIDPAPASYVFPYDENDITVDLLFLALDALNKGIDLSFIMKYATEGGPSNWGWNPHTREATPYFFKPRLTLTYSQPYP